MLLGCHLSIAKGFTGALDAAQALGINALQIFSHNASSWKMKPIAPDAAAAFQKRRAELEINYVVIHTLYLLNLASPQEELFERSVGALTEEVERARALGIASIVTHLGAHKGSGVKSGIERIASGLSRAMGSDAFSSPADLEILLENTAGTGTTLGQSFSELGSVLDLVGGGSRLGVCLDTCHAFAAGYDLRTRKGLEETLVELDREVGLERLKLIHLNDSRFSLGSHRDRHEHIGQGQITEEGISSIVNHGALRDLAFILETPKEIDGQRDADPLNLKRVRSLRRGKEAE